MVLLELNSKSKLLFRDINFLQKKKFWKRAKIFVLAGQAKVAPPISSILGQFGINLLEFCDSFNSKTKHLSSELVLSVSITIFSNKSFNFNIKPIALSELVFSLHINELLKTKSCDNFCIFLYKLYLVFTYSRGITLKKSQFLSLETSNYLRQIFGYLNSFSV